MAVTQRAPGWYVRPYDRFHNDPSLPFWWGLIGSSDPNDEVAVAKCGHISRSTWEGQCCQCSFFRSLCDICEARHGQQG